MTGFRTSNNRGVEGNVDRANELNLFFNKFDNVGQANNTWPHPCNNQMACSCAIFLFTQGGSPSIRRRVLWTWTWSIVVKIKTTSYVTIWSI